MSGTVRLGAFEVLRPIGRGATGVVWQGYHRDTGVPVAIKVLDRTGPGAVGTEAFRNEVRAMVNLDHPAIVRVYDVGRVGPRAAAARPNELEAGAPYVVMEYASGGTLSSFVPTAWDTELLPLLTDLLQALAHAHARQVVHRDLKPGNVILAGPDSPRPGWKLTDFGIATALERTMDRSIAQELVGTLAYMSPEQIEGNWREYGPWTDLYALGCMMYRLVGAARPFGAAKGPALIAAHLTDRPGPLEPELPVPVDLPDWVGRLVEKDPRDRFQSAVEALRALQELGPVVAAGASTPARPDDADATLEGPTEVLRGGSSRAPGRVPEDWRTLASGSLPAAREVSAGLALVALRDPPLVGRTEARDQLWSRFRAVIARGRAEIVVIRGAPGVGRSRLARWVAEIAHERVGVPVLFGEARHGEPPTEALGRPFRRLLRTVRLSADARRARIARIVGGHRPELWDAVDRMLSGGEADLGPEARYAAARQLVERVADPARGVVLLYDDAHLAPDLFGFARHVAQAQGIRPTPLLLVLVVGHRDPPYEARGALGDSLTEIDVGPLGVEDHERLVHAVAPLEPAVAARLAERTAGNPMHAIQVVRGWVRTRQLVPTPGGLALAAPETAVAPMPEVWRDTLRRVLADLPLQARVMLERGAALGTLVDEQDWQRVCDDPSGEWAARGQSRFLPEHGRIRAVLRERLFEEGLADETDDGWRFLQELFRETVLTLAGSAGRLASHHRACARALLHRRDSRKCTERIGRHLLAGERPEQAVPHLFEAFRQRARLGGDRASLPVLADIEEALKLAATDPGDLRWAELGVRRAEVLARLGQKVEAHRLAAQAERQARGGAGRSGPGPWRRLQARAARVVGEVLLDQGDLRAADAAFARAESFVAEAQDPRLLGKIHADRSRCAQGLGEVARARGHAVLAAKFLSEASEKQGMAEAWAVLGERARRDGALGEAEGCFERAAALQARVGTPLGEARALCALGEVAAARSDLTAARDCLVRASDRFREAGSPEALVAVLSLALVELARRDWLEAHRLASVVAAERDPVNQASLELAAHAALAAASAGLRDAASAELHLRRIQTRADRADPDAAWCLELACARLSAAGRDDLAEEARALAARLAPGGPAAPIG